MAASPFDFRSCSAIISRVATLWDLARNLHLRGITVNTFMQRLGALSPLITFLAMFLFFAAISDTFLSAENLLNILRQNSALAVMAVGMTFVLLIGEIDLSVEGMAILAGVTTAALYQILSASTTLPAIVVQGVPILAALAVALLFGMVTGSGTARLGVPSFMMTLSLLLITKGIAIRITRGSPIFDIPPVLSFIGNKSWRVATVGNSALEIPYITMVAAVFLIVALLVLRYTRFGRHIYAAGGNRVAAELSGINVKWVATIPFCICAFTAAFAGILLIGRLGSAQSGGLDNMLIQCVSAVVLGGTSLFGGKGGIANTVIGVLTLGVLYNGLNHVKIDIYLKDAISGTILMAALVLNVTMSRMRGN